MVPPGAEVTLDGSKSIYFDAVRSGLDRDYLPMRRIFEKVIAKTLRGYGNRPASS